MDDVTLALKALDQRLGDRVVVLNEKHIHGCKGGTPQRLRHAFVAISWRFWDLWRSDFASS